MVGYHADGLFGKGGTLKPFEMQQSRGRKNIRRQVHFNMLHHTSATSMFRTMICSSSSRED